MLSVAVPKKAEKDDKMMVDRNLLTRTGCRDFRYLIQLYSFPTGKLKPFPRKGKLIPFLRICLGYPISLKCCGLINLFAQFGY